MPNNCATCTHPQVRQINQRIREGLPLSDTARWLAERGTPITRQALARHAKGHLGAVIPHGGSRPASGRLLEAIVERAEEALEEGRLEVTLRDGIAAQKQLDERMKRDSDKDLLIKIAMVLTGHVSIAVPPPDPEVAAIEAEFRPLLTSGAE